MLAVVLSLAAAVGFAASAMLIDGTTGRVGPLQLSRWQMGLAFAMTALLALGLGGWSSLDQGMTLWLAGSSAVGIMFASITFVATIQMTGPRISALLFTMAAPFALMLGYVFRGETVSPEQGAGTALIILGIVLAVIGPRGVEGHGQKGGLGLGVVLGLLTALGQAVGSLLARPAMLDGADPIAAIAVRTGFGAVFCIALLGLPRLRPAAIPEPEDLRRILGAAIAGMVVGMSLLMAALARGDVGIVTTLSSTTPILILPMVWAVSGRAPPPLAWVGAALAVAGAATISNFT